MARSLSMDQLTAGAHACLTFTDQDERLDLVAAFVAEGLDTRQRVVCLTDAVSAADLSRELDGRAVGCDSALATGQLRIAEFAQTWHDGITAERLLALVDDELASAAAAGAPGVRITADMGWVTRPGAAAQELIRFERSLASRAVDNRLTAICQYDRTIFDPVTLAVTAEVHPEAVAAQVYYEHPLLRICRQYRPPGLRIAGELDFQHLDELSLALAETIRLDHAVDLDLRQLRYIDAACAGAITQAAALLPADRQVTVHCRPLVAKMLTLCGGSGLLRIRATTDA